jgi:polyhydroxybutyrate depolymerase
MMAQSFHTINVDGRQRCYYLYVPAKLPKNAPLVFVFHGYTGKAKDIMNEFGMNAIAGKDKFVVCYPQGSVDKHGDTFWQVGYSFHKDNNVNDVKFICTLASVLQRQYRLSKRHTFMTGVSNGGDLCNYLSYHTKGIFRAMAPIISCIMKETFDFCKYPTPIPTFMLNGTKDQTTYWDGDLADKEGFGPYLSTKAMLDFRIRLNKCTFAKSDTIRSSSPDETRYVIVDKYTNRKTNNQVWMYTVVNGDHGYPEYLKLENEVWRFFKMYLY